MKLTMNKFLFFLALPFLNTLICDENVTTVSQDAMEEFSVQSLSPEKAGTVPHGEHFFNKVDPHSYLHLAKDGDITCDIDGKVRIDSAYGVHTKNLNSESAPIDQFYIPGRSTIDIGISLEAGKRTFDRNIVEIAIDLRNRSTWGKPDEVAYTTNAVIKENGYEFGSHNHEIGVPMVYVRGLDFTMDLNAFFGCDFGRDDENLQFLKMGLFPFEVGRGIALGAAYAVTPDFVTYDPSIVIQEFAPGFMVYGSFGKKGIFDYKAYLGILRNDSASLSDVTANIRSKQFGRTFYPERGFGSFTMVTAGQFNFKVRNDIENKVICSPYIVFYHQGEGKVDFDSDSQAEMTTFGFSFEAEHNNISFGFDCAKNMGTQYVLGIDRNTVIGDQRTVTLTGGSGLVNNSSSASVLVNSKVIYTGADSTTDLKDKNAVYLGMSNARQDAINNVFPSAFNNGTMIPFPASGQYCLKNADDRFRDPYKNALVGWMMVIDAALKTIIGETDVAFGATIGAASGDENPNKPLKSANDYMKDATYEGFIGIQEIYQGKKVKSVFFLSGSGKLPRILSIPRETDNEEGVAVGFPSKISRFTNLIFGGASVDFTLESSGYFWKCNPNLLFFNQMVPVVIYDKGIIDRVGRDSLPSYLGCEANIFLEISLKEMDAMKFFGVATIFFPGSFYSVLKDIPFEKQQIDYITKKESGISTGFSPMVGTTPAFYFNIGLECKF